MKNKLSCFLVMVLLTLLFSQIQITVFAAGTNQNNATEMNVDEAVYDSVDAKGESDWYKITTEDKDAYYYFTLKQESLTNGKLYVYSSRGEEMLQIGHQYSKGGDSYTGNVRLEKSSTYYVKVTTVWEQYTGTYNIKYSYVEDSVGDNKDNATSIDLNKEYKSGIDGTGDCDWFCIEPTVTCDYKVVMSQASLTNAKLYVYTDRDEELLSIGHQYSNAGSKYDGVVSLSAGKKYYVKVTTVFEQYIGEYSIIVSQCANGHTPSDAWVTTKEPTCTGVGEKTNYCSVCNEVLETKQVDAKGHTLGEWKIKVPATWISLGQKEAMCEICGEVETGKDWSKAWIIPVIILGGVVLIVGVVNYIKSFKRSRW